MGSYGEDCKLDPDIIDIRADGKQSLDIRSHIVESLHRPFGCKTLPALLLWDEKGQRLYYDILANDFYYPHREETAILKQRATAIADAIVTSRSEVVVELGAGNLTKTSILLSALDRRRTPLVYYALDLDKSELEKSLAALRQHTKLEYVQLSGLLGTYEDGIRWLSSASQVRGKRKTFVWLGNSMANMTTHMAQQYLGAFADSQDAGELGGFLVGLDGCADASLIELAYDVPGGANRRWIKYILEAARGKFKAEAAVARELFSDDDWQVEGHWDSNRSRYENCIRADRDLKATLLGKEIHIAGGEPVEVLWSGKWCKTDVEKICGSLEWVVADWWTHAETNYSVYWLQPAVGDAIPPGSKE